MKIQSAFSPLTRVANLREITSIEEYETALAHELAVIFKHSKYCDLSHDAYQTVTRFCSAEPAATILLICVPKFREVAAFVEKQTRVRHESPQILAMRNGVVFAHASHGRITAGPFKITLRVELFGSPCAPDRTFAAASIVVL